MEWFPSTALRRRALEIMARLEAAYHAAPPHRGQDHRLPAVDELVLTLLSQSTTDVNSWRGYEALRARFPSWDAVADAPLAAVEEAIRPGGLSRQKAPRIQALLRRIRAEHGAITLEGIAAMPPDEALAYLMSFHGVGRKTASCVLLFSLGLPAMPVDTHVLRVARRLELIPATASADQAHDLLEALLPEENYLTFHVNMIAHGRRTCTARHPACERCVVLELCPYGMRLLGLPGSEGLSVEGAG
jgi:endonuclease III